MRIRVEAPVRASEDPQKVETAVRAFFPDGRVSRLADRLVLETESMDAFREAIWRARILDAARRQLLGAVQSGGREASFLLNKQAAYAGRLSFAVGEAPLGDLRVTVEGDDLEAGFKALVPPTLRGHPVSEEEYERHLERQRKQRADRVGRSREEEE